MYVYYSISPKNKVSADAVLQSLKKVGGAQDLIVS